MFFMWKEKLQVLGLDLVGGSGFMTSLFFTCFLFAKNTTNVIEVILAVVMGVVVEVTKIICMTLPFSKKSNILLNILFSIFGVLLIYCSIVANLSYSLNKKNGVNNNQYINSLGYKTDLKSIERLEDKIKTLKEENITWGKKNPINIDKNNEKTDIITDQIIQIEKEMTKKINYNTKGFSSVFNLLRKKKTLEDYWDIVLAHMFEFCCCLLVIGTQVLKKSLKIKIEENKLENEKNITTNIESNTKNTSKKEVKKNIKISQEEKQVEKIDKIIEKENLVETKKSSSIKLNINNIKKVDKKVPKLRVLNQNKYNQKQWDKYTQFLFNNAKVRKSDGLKVAVGLQKIGENINIDESVCKAIYEDLVELGYIVAVSPSNGVRGGARYTYFTKMAKEQFKEKTKDLKYKESNLSKEEKKVV